MIDKNIPVKPQPKPSSTAGITPGGQPIPQRPPGKSTPSSPEDAENENLRKLVSQMAEENPAGLAEIIRMWLKEDQNR